MFKKLVVITAITVLAGCATAPKSKFDAINVETAGVLQGAGTLGIEVAAGKGMAHFTGAEQAMMTTGMLFGAIGGAIGASAAISSANRRGAELARTDNIVNPSEIVAEKMRQRLQSDHRLSTTIAADTRLVLSTTNWVKQGNNVGYFVLLKVIDAQTSNVRTKGECKYFREGKQLAVSSEALLANNAEKLKQEYENAAEHCTGYFMQHLFPAKVAG